MPSPRRILPLARLLVALAAVAHLAVACAGFWHRHDDARPHNECAICVAAHAERTDGLPPQRFNPPAPRLVGLIAAPAPRDPSVRPVRPSLARGPPEA